MNGFFNKNQNVPLIRVEQKNGNNVVSARELYSFLQVKTDFSDWCKRMFEYGFTEDKDFTPILGKSLGGRPSIDYALTLDTAKEIAMIQRTEKGKQARQYFIECEKQLQRPSKPLTPSELILMQAQRLVDIEKQQTEQAEELRAIQDQRYEAEAYLEEIGLEPVSTFQVSTRKAVDSLVKAYSEANGIAPQSIYTIIYKRFETIYRKNVSAVAKRQKISVIGWIEQNGWIGELYEVAKEVLKK
jgi:phage anti-repressor protein